MTEPTFWTGGNTTTGVRVSVGVVGTLKDTSAGYIIGIEIWYWGADWYTKVGAIVSVCIGFHRAYANTGPS